MNFPGAIPALLHMGLLFWLSSIPGKNLPLPFPQADKIEHLLAYGVLGVLLACRPGFSQALRFRKPETWTGGGMGLPLIGLLYGISDEVHQLFVPGRSFSVADMLCDGTGVFLGFFLLRRLEARRRADQKKDS